MKITRIYLNKFDVGSFSPKMLLTGEGVECNYQLDYDVIIHIAGVSLTCDELENLVLNNSEKDKHE
jgi:hypothetical protein